MKILFITAEGFDTPNPNNQMAESMINGFIKNGNSVHLIQSHRKGINPDIPNSLLNKMNFTHDTVIRKSIDKTNFIRRYLNEILYAFQSMKYWIKIKEIDVIYLQSNPTIIFPLVLLFIFKHRVPIVYSIYDVFPGHAYDIGVIRSKILYNILKLLQKPCYRIAEAILVLGEDMKEKVVKEGVSSERVFTVPAWFETNHIHEITWQENRFVKKYDLNKEKFYVQFAGTVGYVFNYHTVIALAERLKEDKDIVIQIVGDGNVKKEFQQEASKRNLNNISFYPLQPVDLVPDVYSACNICIIPLMKGVIGNGIPSKAPILMACKRVIVNSVECNSNYAKMFIDNEMGIAVEIEDTRGLANAILRLKSHPELIHKMAENALKYGRRNYTSISSINIILNVFQLVTKKMIK